MSGNLLPCTSLCCKSDRRLTTTKRSTKTTTTVWSHLSGQFTSTRQTSVLLPASLMWEIFDVLYENTRNNGGGCLTCLSPTLGRMTFVYFNHFASKPLAINKKVATDHRAFANKSLDLYVFSSQKLEFSWKNSQTLTLNVIFCKCCKHLTRKSLLTYTGIQMTIQWDPCTRIHTNDIVI